jgi:hypothetical protein
MQSQQDVSSSKQDPEERHRPRRGDPKLKSERVQWHLQLPERYQQEFHEATGRNLSVGEVITVSVDVTNLARALTTSVPPSGGSMGGSGAIVEAGQAFGTPDHNHQPSTSRKEEDHGTS